MYQKFYQKSLVFIPGFLLVSSILLAQSSYRLTGTVSSKQGETIPGVNILIQDHSKGAVTDIDGTYSLELEGTEILVFSAIGYVSQSIPVNRRNIIDLSLQEDTQLLNEVVVIGYGSVDKSDLTGAVSSLKSKDFNPGANSSVDQLILGRSAGVQVSQTSSEPGGGLSIRIRGASSVNAGNEPLYVIDGFPVDNSPC